MIVTHAASCPGAVSARNGPTYQVDCLIGLDPKLGHDCGIRGSSVADTPLALCRIRRGRHALDVGSVPTARFDDPLCFEFSKSAGYGAGCETEICCELTDRR
jgi:hypothetical protein